MIASHLSVNSRSNELHRINAGFIDTSSIDIESLGSNSMGFGRNRGGQFQGWNGGNEENLESFANNGNEIPAGPGRDGNFRPQNGQGEPNANNVAPPCR